MTWPLARVGDLAEQVRGVTFAKGETSPVPAPGLLPVMTATNVTELGLVNDSVLHLPRSKVGANQILRKNDVLVTASSGSLSVVGRAVLVREELDATFGAFCKVLRPRGGVDPHYFAHFFRTSEYRSRVSRVAAGANINNLRNEDLDGFEIPLPPLPEQRRIASILDRAEELRSSGRISIARQEQFLRELCHDAVSRSNSSTSLPLSAITTRITDGTHQAPRWASDGVPFLFVSNIIGGKIDYSTEKFVSRATYDQLTRHAAIEAGDVLYSAVGSYGVPVLVSDDRPFLFQRHIAHIKPRAEFVNSRYLRDVLASSSIRRQADRVAKGVAQKTVTLGDLSRFSIPMIDREAQEQYAALATKSDRLSERLADRQSVLDELFAALQYRAFRDDM